jgi:hypothetical protein
MFKWIFRLIFIFIIGLLLYNYFLGDPEEKQLSKEIATQAKSLGKSLSTLVVSEKEKFDRGKYDDALDKVGGFISGLKKEKDSMSEESLLKLQQLEEQKNNLQVHLEKVDKMPAEEKEVENKSLKQELEALIKGADSLLQSLE